jgi:hypothetical protein
MMARPTATSAAAMVRMKKTKTLPSRVPLKLRERDQRERRGQQHELEAHVDHERVLAQQHAEEPDGEQQGADEQVGRQAVNGGGGEESM